MVERGGTDMVEITCKCGCGRKRMVRTADVARGWGKFFNKRCKAREQERRTGQYADYLANADRKNNDYDSYDPHPFSSEALGQDWD